MVATLSLSFHYFFWIAITRRDRGRNRWRLHWGDIGESSHLIE